MKIKFEGKKEAVTLIEVTLSFTVNETEQSTIRHANLDIIVSGELHIAGREYIIKCRNFYEADRIWLYSYEAVYGIIKKYKRDIKSFFYDAIIKNFDFSMAQEKGHLVLVDGERWKKEQEIYDFKLIEDGSCIACGRL